MTASLLPVENHTKSLSSTPPDLPAIPSLDPHLPATTFPCGVFLFPCASFKRSFLRRSLWRSFYKIFPPLYPEPAEGPSPPLYPEPAEGPPPPLYPEPAEGLSPSPPSLVLIVCIRRSNQMHYHISISTTSSLNMKRQQRNTPTTPVSSSKPA
jgi:hypothetical protein